MNRVVVGLGSNIDPDRNVRKAKAILAREYNVLAESRFELTRSVEDTRQADFLNGALLLQTELGREPLTAALKDIESQLGRGNEHDPEAPRTIDLDIVLWNETIVDQDFYERDYLKRSVLELVPDLKY